MPIASCARRGSSVGCIAIPAPAATPLRAISQFRCTANSSASRSTPMGESRSSGSSIMSCSCRACSSSASALHRVVHVRHRVAFEVDEAQRELQPADAVGDGVVDALQQRGTTVGEPFDQRELPERTGAVERSGATASRRRRAGCGTNPAPGARPGGGGTRGRASDRRATRAARSAAGASRPARRDAGARRAPARPWPAGGRRRGPGRGP